MLILAGVSLNAIVGDNGIITKAQEANVQSSIASLEEFLQLKYTENYEEMSQYKNKIEGLTNVCSEYFYIPSIEGIGGLRYVIDSDGHALYLIKKSGLPEEIRESLTGGDAGAGEYSDYATLNDVYGVTSNLQVYYCSGGTDSIKGLAKESLDNDDPQREVFSLEDNSSFYELLNGYDKNSDEQLSVEELRDVVNLTINNDSRITSLKDIYNLVNLEEITLDSINLSSLEGLGNCSHLKYLCFLNYGNGTADILDYTELNKTSKIEYLYLQKSNDNQVNKVFNVVKNTDYRNLLYLGIFDGGKNVTDISVLGNLTETTKNSVKYLYLYCNDLSDLSGINDFVNTVEIKVYSNSNLVTLKSLKKMLGLLKIYASGCDLGRLEVYNEDQENNGKNVEEDALSIFSDKMELYYIDLTSNKNLKWIGYLENCKKMQYMYLAGCGNLIGSEVKKIAPIYNTLTVSWKSIDEKFLPYLSNSVRRLLQNQNLTDSSSEFLALENDLECKQLNLGGNSNLSDEKLRNILKTMRNMEYLNLSELGNLTNIDFVENMPNLKELILTGTKVTDVSILNDNCMKLASLTIDNDEIDLTLIQNCINRLYDNVNNFWKGEGNSLSMSGTTWRTGLVLLSQKLYDSLESCENIDRMYLGYGGFAGLNYTCDLSGTKLEKIITYCCPTDFVLPKTLNLLSFDNPCFGVKVDGTLCTAINEIKLTDFAVPNQNTFDASIESFSTFPNLSSLYLSSITGNYGLDIFNECSFPLLQSLTLKGKSERKRLIDLSGIDSLKDSLKTLIISYSSDSLTDFQAIGSLTNLNVLSITNTYLSNIDFIKNLSELNNLTLSNNKINSCVPFKDLVKLTGLDLSNNLIGDRSSGESNLSILASLNKNNGKRKIRKFIFEK